MTPLELDGDPWQTFAACRDTDGDAFFTDDGTPLARATCKHCPVTEHCLDDALRNPDPHGFRAGYTAAERAKLFKNAIRAHRGNRPLKPIPHGTRAGYKAHQRRGSKPCQACKDADRRVRYP